MNSNTKKWLRRLSTASLCVGLVACGGNSGGSSSPTSEAPEPETPESETPEPVTREFRIDVVNLTAAQPFSPVAVIAHNGDYSLFTVGLPASEGLELMAEGGDNSSLLLEADNSGSVFTTLSDSGPTPPGGSSSLTITVEEAEAANLTLTATTMLVNTNDAFSALNSLPVADIAVGETLTRNTISYDSGTEANSEAAGTIPGPIDGGEGFNEARDDIADEVRMHSGVLTVDGGLSSSALSDIHRWDNPVARISITRVR